MGGFPFGFQPGKGSHNNDPAEAGSWVTWPAKKFKDTRRKGRCFDARKRTHALFFESKLFKSDTIGTPGTPGPKSQEEFLALVGSMGNRRNNKLHGGSKNPSCFSSVFLFLALVGSTGKLGSQKSQDIFPAFKTLCTSCSVFCGFVRSWTTSKLVT